MNNADRLSQKIKEGFEQNEFKVPNDLWTKINNNIENQDDILDGKVKSSFEKFNERAPERIWFGIEKQLTIDQAWKKIHHYLKLQTFYKWTKRSVAIILIVVIGISIFNFSTQKNKENKVSLSKNVKTIDVPKNLTTKILLKPNLKNLHKKSNVSKVVNHSENKSTYFTTDQEISQLFELHSFSQARKSLIDSTIKVNINEDRSLNTGYENFQTPTFQNIESLNSKDCFLENCTSPTKVMFFLERADNYTRLVKNNALINNRYLPNNLFKKPLDLDKDFPSTNVNNKFENQKTTKFEIGLITALNTTALINETTINSLQETSLVSFVPSFGGNFGIQFGYNFDIRHSLIFNFTYSSLNQVYNTFSNGEFNNEKIHIDFNRFLPFYQFSFHRNKTNSNKMNLKLGPYFELVTNTTRTINNAPIPLNYKNYDLGLTLQIGHNIKFQNYVFDYGLNIDKSLSDLNKGELNLSPTMNRTTYLAVGTYASFRYKF